MKLDMSADAINERLEQVRTLNELCLSLAQSSAGLETIRSHPDDPILQRTAMALGMIPESELKARFLAFDRSS